MVLFAVVVICRQRRCGSYGVLKRQATNSRCTNSHTAVVAVAAHVGGYERKPFLNSTSNIVAEMMQYNVIVGWCFPCDFPLLNSSCGSGLDNASRRQASAIMGPSAMHIECQGQSCIRTNTALAFRFGMGCNDTGPKGS
eukprot:355657-Chlamydomonas_euryale.AAC.8